MDYTFKYLASLGFMCLLHSISYAVSEKVDALDSLNYQFMNEEHESSFKGSSNSPKSFVKRSADWSNRNSKTSYDVLSRLDAQDSENVEVTSKMPRIVRKMRFQNVTPKYQNLEKNGINVEQISNETTPDQKGRIVRVRKFKRRTTTAKPQTPIALLTTTKSTTTTSSPVTRQMSQQYSHITVINKEIRDPKPNRKHKLKQSNFWVPSEIPDRKQTQQVNNDVPFPYETENLNQRLDITRNNVPDEMHYSYDATNKISNANTNSVPNPVRKTSSVEIATPSSSNDSFGINDAAISNTGTPKDERKNRSSRRESNIKKESKNSDDSLPRNSPKKPNDESNNSSVLSEPQSVEILSDISQIEKFSSIQNKPQTYIDSKDNIKNLLEIRIPGITETSTYQSPNLQQPRQMHPNFNFRQFPQQSDIGFRSYPYGSTNPFFRPVGPQMQQPQNGNRLPTNSFQRPFSPFYNNNDPRFQEHYSNPNQMSPYHRSGSLGSPNFYHSPQLASLRRSIIDAYEEEESIEATTEFSLPKFEIPSIDFNDKGCRTVYKEVSALPSADSYSGKAENKAKSFIMTRECFFPEGVPTTKSVTGKDDISGTTPVPKR